MLYFSQIVVMSFALGHVRAIAQGFYLHAVLCVRHIGRGGAKGSLWGWFGGCT